MSFEPLGSFSDDEAFRGQLHQMMEQGPGAHGAGDVFGSQAAEASSNGVHVEDESPFKPPQLPTSSYSAPTLTESGAYPRPAQSSSNMSRVDAVKNKVQEFTVETFRTTKQIFNEIMGKGGKTVDPHLDTEIHELKALQAAYMRLIEDTTNYLNYFSNVIYAQKQLSTTLEEMVLREPRLAADFKANGEAQKALIQSGDQLLGALRFFISSMKTMVQKTMQDCLDTIKKYESARLQYDTYRHEHEKIIHNGETATMKSAEIRQKYEERKKRYEQLKEDITVKIKFLEENRVKVVHRQMILLHNSMTAYFSGNKTQLDSALEQFNIKLRSPNSEDQSFLETE